MQHYSEIGALLRNARKDAHLSLTDAAQRLHIRARYLEALEEGKFEEMPGLAYAKGYLQAYAAFLQLDRVEILRRFERVEISIARRGFYLPDILSRAKTPTALMIWAGLAAALLAYVLWWGTLKPVRYDISDIEAWKQQGAEKMHLSAATIDNVACLHAPEHLYPPCHATGMPPYGPLPLHRRRVRSVMDLW